MSQQEQKPPVLLIDLSALYHASHHVVHESEPVSKVHDIVLSSVRRCVDAVPGALIAICCDSRTNWRKALSPEYKSTREQKPASFFEEFDRLKDRLRRDGYLLWQFDGYEADDVIASAADIAVLAGHFVTIASPDKDLCQLSAEMVTMLSTRTWEKMDRDAVIRKFGVAPHQIGDLLALMGDKADNVKGVEGIGAVLGAELLQKYGNVTDLYAEAKDLVKVATDPYWRTADGKSPKKIHDKLMRAEADVMLARKLVTLKYDIPLKFDEIYEERKPMPLTEDQSEDAEFENMISPGPGPGPASPAAVESSATTTPSAVDATKPKPAPENPPPAVGTSVVPGAGQGQMVVAPQPAKLDEKSLALAQFDENLQPTGMRGLYWFAQRAIESRFSTKFGTVDKALMVMARGKDFGLSPSAAMELMQDIQGKLTLPAQLLVAMAKRHPDCEYFYLEDVSPEAATAVTKRKGAPKEERRTYTLEMAKRAGLLKPGGGWEKNPEDMCVWRATSKLARQVYPDATMGAYSFEEMEGA